VREQSGGYLARPTPSGLADVVEIVLDKGIVIDAYVRVSLVGIELLTIDARIVVASVDTYLRFAEATNRLDLSDKGGRTLPEMLTEGTQSVVTNIASTVVEHKVDDAMDSVGDTLGAPAEKVARSAAGKLVDVAETVAGKAIDAVDHTDEE
jgi:gas vesicle structural protein